MKPRRIAIVSHTTGRSASNVSHGYLRQVYGWEQVGFYSRFLWRFIVLRRAVPLIYGIALTDRCNFTCRGCRVANTGRPDMTWEQLQRAMRDAWNQGYREIYFSGGEPMLWHEENHSLEDVVSEARRTGFFHVHVYTNGTLGLDSGADLVWVSMDGLPETYRIRRNDRFHEVEEIIRQSNHPGIAVIYVIDSGTEKGIEPFLDWVRDTGFPVRGVFFYFHTPYYGRDELYLDSEQRKPVIDRLIRCIRSGKPVLNSQAGLKALRSGKWPRRLPLSAVRDVDGEYVCCRASDDVCNDCGYAACTELTQFQRLRPSALLGMLRYL